MWPSPSNADMGAAISETRSGAAEDRTGADALDDAESAPGGPQVLGPDRTITAGIYRTDAGLELRVVNGDNPNDLYDSLLSRDGDAPLEFRADELKAVLTEQGWTRKDAE